MISKLKYSILVLVFQIAFYSSVFAAPLNGIVANGDVTFSDGNTVINQNSDKAIVNWDSFNINTGETVTFNQNSSSSIILNRISGGQTNILGNINANGKVFLLNPNGIVFGSGSSVNVGGLLATTANISDADFMSGALNFTGAVSDIINNGNINITDLGYAVLMGRKVTNNGVIAAKLGTVQLASGTDFRLTFSGSDLIGLNIDVGNLDAETINSGSIFADGSTVALSSKGVANALTNAVNNTGVITANAISNVGGVIRLTADGGSVSSVGNVIGAKADISSTAGNINVTNMKTTDFIAKAQTDVTASVLATSNIDVESLGGGKIDVTNANTGNVFIDNLKSTGIVRYTQTGGGNLDFNPLNVTGGASLDLLNTNGTINSNFDFFHLGNVSFTANRINLINNNTNKITIDQAWLTRLITTNLSLSGLGDFDFAAPFIKSDLNLTLATSGGSVVSPELLTLASLNVKAFGNISLNTALSKFSANSQTGNITLVNTGNLTVNNLVSKNGFINIENIVGNLDIFSIDSSNIINIKTEAGVSVAVRGNGNPLSLNLLNGANTSLEVSNNGNLDLAWTNGDFAKLTLRSLENIKVANTNIFSTTGDIFIQAASLNIGNPLAINSGGNAIIKLTNVSNPIFLKANTADITGVNMDIISENNIAFADLDNDGFAIQGGNVSITTSGGFILQNIAQADSLSIFSSSFEFLVVDAIINARNFTLKSFGDITGIGRINAGNVNISGNTIGVKRNSSLFINAERGVLTATSDIGGQTINISSSSWFNGVKNFEFVTSGDVYLNGRNTNKTYYALIQKALGRDLFPIEMINISKLTEYKLTRNMEEKKNIISYDLDGREQPLSIIKINGKYSIR